MASKTMFHKRSQPLRPTPRDPATPPTSQETGLASAASPSSTPAAKRPRPPRPKPADDDGRIPPPEGPCDVYSLVSSSLKGWRYDVMKFDSRKPVDLSSWSKPVKLNRKETRRATGNADGGMAAPIPVGPMLGPDGKPVIGMDGKVVMVDAEGRPIRPGQQQQQNGSAGGSTNGDGGKGKDKEKEKDKAAAKKRFQKKTKQVFLVPDEVRQLRREERYPWVMEDSSGQEVWVAAMEEVSKAQTQAMFMPTTKKEFKFVPAHRWYKFQKKPNYHIPDLEEAETLMSRIQKNKDPERWFLRKKQGASEETKAMFKGERGGSVVPSGASLVYSAGESLGPGGRKLRTVDSGMGGLFGDEDEDGVPSRRQKEREYGAEGDLDELDFEEDFADDEEKPEAEADDEEAKELEERLKREYKNANKTREGYIDESEEEEDMSELTGAGKDMQKLMKKHEKNNAYDDSDDDKNPYASSEEEPDEEVPIVPQGPAIIPPEQRPSSRSNSQAPSGSQPPVPPAGSKPLPAQDAGSRATSPIPAPGHGGHSVVAMRATSPNAKMPKLKANGSSRASSPLATGSRATSPVAGAGSPPPAGRAESPPAATSSASGVTSPPANGKPNNKRKAEDGAAPGKPKKRKAQATVTGELEDAMVIEWLRNTPNASTRDCIHHFTPYLTSEEKKQAFTKLVKEVAQLKNNVLVLRNAYRNPGGAPSPAAGSPMAE
ncbi:Rap30/74 interaction domain-containing protein [Trametopsis cervina]|nr:Rap30/74 interaction domain-containing protein [Trametopsis cervina]